MSQEKISHDCKTTVLTESLAVIHDDHCLGRWVRDRTGDPDARYDLLAVRSFAGLDADDFDVLAGDVRTAVSLHNGERLLVYGRYEGLDRAVRALDRRLSDLRGCLRIEPYELRPGKFSPGMEAPSSAVVLTCMDWRLHGRKGGIGAIVKANMETRRAVIGDVDLLTTAGCAQDLVLAGPRRDLVLAQLATYETLEPTVYLTSHIDCGKYGGSRAFDSGDAERSRLADDLRRAAEALTVLGPAFDIVPAIAVVNDESVTDLITL